MLDDIVTTVLIGTLWNRTKSWIREIEIAKLTDTVLPPAKPILG
jgi:hypothetical protein